MNIPRDEQCPKCQTPGKESGRGLDPIWLAGLWLAISVVVATVAGIATLVASRKPLNAMVIAIFAASIPAAFTFQALWQFWRLATSERTRLRCPACHVEWELPAS